MRERFYEFVVRVLAQSAKYIFRYREHQFVKRGFENKKAGARSVTLNLSKFIIELIKMEKGLKYFQNKNIFREKEASNIIIDFLNFRLPSLSLAILC